MTAGLIGKKIYMHVFLNEILKQIYHITVIGDGTWFFLLQLFSGNLQCLRETFRHTTYPALFIAGTDAGYIHLCYNGYSAGDHGSFALSAAHAA